MKKICIIGGPSSGKTLAALAIIIQLKLKRYIVRHVLEYATEYIVRNGSPKNAFEEIAMFCGQRDEEGYKEKLSGGDFLVTDGASFLACVYARHFRPKVHASKEEIQKYNYVLKTLDKWAREQTLPTYDYIFFVPIEFGFQKDGIRYQVDEEEAKKTSDGIERYLKFEGIKYFYISGPLKKRVEKMLKIIQEAEEKEKNPKIFPLIE